MIKEQVQSQCLFPIHQPRGGLVTLDFEEFTITGNLDKPAAVFRATDLQAEFYGGFRLEFDLYLV